LVVAGIVAGIVALVVIGAVSRAGESDRSPSAPVAVAETTSTTGSTPGGAPPTTERHAAATSTPTTAPPAPGEGRRAVVGSITDGDTFRTVDGERIRLIGIDTPEVAQDACFAAEATAAITALIAPGTEVLLVLDLEATDRYGRTLAYVHRASDDLFVNRELAVQGYAVQLTIPPNVARVDELGAAVGEARDAGRGLWAGCPAVPAPPTTSVPPLPAVPQTQPPASGCDASYPDVCIPPAPPDLDCGQIPHRRFRVIGADPHGFDGDRDGVGCES
jgi:micrococcal nuclease